MTGCDYCAALHRKGKNKPFQVLQKSEVMQDAFAQLGQMEFIDYQLEEKMEAFTCALYGGRGKTTSVDELRYQKLSNTKKSLRTTDPASLPPCRRTLRQKLKSLNYVSNMWRQAPIADMELWDPKDHGYKEENGRLTPLWFEGPEKPDITYAPQDIPDSDSDSDSSCSDSDSDDDPDLD